MLRGHTSLCYPGWLVLQGSTRRLIKKFSAQYTMSQQTDTKSQSVNTLILLKVFARENRTSKLLITVGNSCKEETGVSNRQNGEG